MKKGLLFVLFLVYFVGFGQCPAVIIDSQSGIDNFATNYPGCTEFESVEIYMGILNLNGLNQIESIIGELSINGTDIQNLSGLDNLVYVGGDLRIESNNLLQNFQGLNQLETVGGALVVVQDDLIQNFLGFDSLISLGSGSLGFNLLIAQNDSLLSLSGLENLVEITGGLGIEFNSSLQTLIGLNGLTHLYGQIYIHSNSNLQTLEGLENLQFFENRLYINFNDKLTSLYALSNTNFSSINEVTIEDNDLLSFCAVESVCLAISTSGAEVIIQYNVAGCNSIPEVEDQCLMSIKEADFSNNLSVYPNPVTSTLQIETSKTISFEKAIIYSTLGKKILETSENQINLETLSAGIYFVEVVTGKGAVTKKIVKD